MKLIKKLQLYKNQFLIFLSNNNIYLDRYTKLIAPIIILTFLSLVIWFKGANFQWGNYAPLSGTDKKIYGITVLWLIWILKNLLWAGPDPTQYKDAKLRHHLQKLHEHFYFILHYLNKTPHDEGKLADLPWYLLLGPTDAGKTMLLKNAQVNYILKKQVGNEIETDKDCAWWITRDITFIDIPGKYLHLQNYIHKPSIYPILWNYFLRSIKKTNHKQDLGGIILALPLPELMKENDPKKYQFILRGLSERLHDIKKIFPQPIPCYIVITKCDLLPGFSEFFAESTSDEIHKSWGITLTSSSFNDPKKIQALLADKLNELIKKLNQQLIWRLHQERNPMARPYIKDFPLQVENLKNNILDFIKKLSNDHFVSLLQGVYLTSALQQHTQEDTSNEPIDTTQRDIQLFKEPANISRPYFIKHLLTHYFKLKNDDLLYAPALKWKKRFAYIFSLTIISVISFLLITDFRKSVGQMHFVQDHVTTYQLQLHFHDSYKQLLDAVDLIENLQKLTKSNAEFKLDLKHLSGYYSGKSQNKINDIYKKSLETALTPAIKNVLEDYLKTPVNKNLDSIYTALKAYLMLGQTEHFKEEYILNTIVSILPSSMSDAEKNRLMKYLHLALKNWQPIVLDQTLVQQTRDYLISTPSFQLSYIILKNLNTNYLQNEVDLGHHADIIFVKKRNLIPSMFTVKSFTNTFSKEANIATQETILGNWVLGDFNVNNNPKIAGELLETLRETYLTNYVKAWENFLMNIHLNNLQNLSQADNMITALTDSQSPLLQLLQIVYENTYFDPVISASPNLKNLSLLIAKDDNTSSSMLFEIFTSLRSLQKKIKIVLASPNEKKAAFELISERMHHPKTLDDITRIRVIADKSPEPIKSWLTQLTDDVWRLLTKDASRYIDTSDNEKSGEKYA